MLLDGLWPLQTQLKHLVVAFCFKSWQINQPRIVSTFLSQ
ncbi:hypothetical protein LINGRAHAP2_LOCUS30257, partial [Linum grandiflorum]